MSTLTRETKNTVCFIVRICPCRANNRCVCAHLYCPKNNVPFILSSVMDENWLSVSLVLTNLSLSDLSNVSRFGHNWGWHFSI